MEMFLNGVAYLLTSVRDPLNNIQMLSSYSCFILKNYNIAAFMFTTNYQDIYGGKMVEIICPC